MKRAEPATQNLNAVPDAPDYGDQTLVELLDRLLNTGVVVCGDLNISVADIELAYLRLQLVLTSVETARQSGWFIPASDLAGERSVPVHP